MATVSFRLRSKANKNVSIKIRVSLDRENVFESTTGFSINPKEWSSSSNYPKNTSFENKQLFNTLQKLELFVRNSLNKDLAQDTVIDRFWLDSQIIECFNRVIKTDTSLLLNHTQYIIDNSSTRKVKKNGGYQIGLSKSTIKNYNSFKNIIVEYETHIKKKIKFLEINRPFVEKFTNWLINSKGYAVNYAGKQLEIMKTVCKDADKNEIPTASYSRVIEHFRESDKDRHIHTLSYDEIEKVRTVDLSNATQLKEFKKENPDLTYRLPMTPERLENVRKWILIGCSIGQRGGDLLSINDTNIRQNLEGDFLLDLVQKKTEKDVTIIINEEPIIEILKNDLPTKLGEQKMNEYTKVICKLAGIDELTMGKKHNKETNRRVLGLHPKYEFITSHCFRRSFVTNKYKDWNTATIMDVTGHSKESLVQTYINKREDKDLKANLQRKEFLNQTKDKKPQLTVIKNGTDD
jgi:integrase